MKKLFTLLFTTLIFANLKGDLMYQTVQRPDLTVMGIECRTSNAPDKGPIDIPKHWERFFSENISSLIPNKASNDIIALYCDYEKDDTLPYSIVIGYAVDSVDTIPEGLVAKNVPGGTFAVFPVHGQYPQSLIATWQKIWQTKDLHRTFTSDYELYGDKFFLGGSPLQIFIAIED